MEATQRIVEHGCGCVCLWDDGGISDAGGTLELVMQEVYIHTHVYRN